MLWYLWELSALVAQLAASLTGDQEVADLSPTWYGSILSWKYMKYFFGHSLPSADSSSAVVSLWQKNVHKYWLTA